MASKKITKQMKHSILNKAMDWKFGQADKEMAACEAEMAKKVFNAIVTPAIRKILSSLPGWMLVEISSIGLDDAGKTLDPKGKHGLPNRCGTVRLDFTEGTSEIMVRTSRWDSNFPAEAIESLSDTLKSDLIEFILLRQAHNERQGNFRAKLDNLLDQVSTTGKLVEIMPEAEEWLPEVYHCSNIPQADTVADLLAI